MKALSFPVLRLGLFPKEDSEMPHHSSSSSITNSRHRPVRCIGAHNGNGRIYTVTRDVRLCQMSVRSFTEVIAIHSPRSQKGSPFIRHVRRSDRHSLVSLRRGITDRRVCRGGSPSVRRPFAVVVRSPSVHSRRPFAVHSQRGIAIRPFAERSPFA